MQKGRSNKTAIWLFSVIFLLFMSVLTTSAAQNINTAKVSLNLKAVTVKEFFDAVKKQTNLNFIYNSELTKGMSRITVQSVDKPVKDVLDKVMREAGCSYEIDGNIVTVTYQQQTGKMRKLAGEIVDDEGLGLPGVNVFIKGTKQRVITDVDGRYIIEIPTGECTVTYSYIGMKTQEIHFRKGGESMLKNVTMTSDTKIDEVVVTGIVIKNKSSFTGSASSFSGEELKAVGVQNPIASLKSLDPSFNVLDNSTFGSDPNHLPNIEIRGKSSMLGMRDELAEDPNQPLFILDGFESTLSAIYNLDITRIASMTILKDAASTAIYGSKAANGVVVVETVKPKPGKLRLSYNGSMDVSIPDLTSYNLMNASEKLEFEKMAGKYKSDGDPATTLLYDDIYQKHLADIKSGVDTYWLSEPIRTGINHRHSLYADGGAGGFMFGIGLNYNGVDGVMKKSNRDVYGATLDIIYRLGKLQFTNKFSAQQTVYTDPIVAFSEYAAACPYYKKYDDEGGVDKYLANNKLEEKIGNPLYNDALNSRNETKSLVISDYFIAEYSPISDLRLRARVGLTATTNENEVFYSPDDTRFTDYNTLKKGLYTYSNLKRTNLEGELTATYAKVIKDMHRFNVSLGGNISEQNAVNQGYTAQGFPSGDFTYPSFSNGYVEGGTPKYNESVSRAVSGYLIGGYSLLDRYLLDCSYRLNGSSVFGSNKKFINTWSVGLGWNLHNEKFIKEALPFINYFKIRGSIGNPGNQNFSSAMSLTTFNYSFSSYNYFGMGTTLSRLGNPNLSWQTTLDKNIGIDLTLFNNRLIFNVDYYHKKTDPLLISIGLPSSSGITSYNTNLGNQLSQGFTGTAQYYVLRNFDKRLTWSIRGSIRMEKSKLGGIGDALESLNKYGQKKDSRSVKRYYDGSDPDDIWAVRSAGIDPANGRELFIKKDGTYTYDFTYADEVIVGNTRPKAEGTFGTSFGYKGFTASATFRYRMGGKSFNDAVFYKVEYLSSDAIAKKNLDKRALYDRWQKPGDVAMFKNISDLTYTPMSSRFVQTENTLTLESFSVGYEFEPKLVRPLGISGLRLNAYMNDIFRLSTIKQERGTSYPFARSVSFALSFTM